MSDQLLSQLKFEDREKENPRKYQRGESTDRGFNDLRIPTQVLRKESMEYALMNGTSRKYLEERKHE